jgi:hypothetical protein
LSPAAAADCCYCCRLLLLSPAAAAADPTCAYFVGRNEVEARAAAVAAGHDSDVALVQVMVNEFVIVVTSWRLREGEEEGSSEGKENKWIEEQNINEKT